MSDRGRLATRTVGALLLALVVVPWYRLVGVRGTSPAVEQTLRLAPMYLVTVWVGCALTLVGAALLGRLLPRGALPSAWKRVERWLASVRAGRLGLALGLLSACGGLAFSTWVLERKPALLDGVVQLVQARYLAAGMLAGPPLEYPEFWQFQFMVNTNEAWASQYPPGFAALLAVSFRFGLQWLVGPLLLGVLVWLTALIAERLFPDDATVARWGAGLVAVSPFLLFHAGAYMNHVLAAVLLAGAVLASLRAVRGSWRWSLVAGAGVGWAIATRPYIGVVLGFFATVVLWLGAPERQRFTIREWTARLSGVVAGASPFVVGLLAYNASLFGHPLRFGYVAAEGPGHGLGFHTDPWGDPYGPLQALGYTSADLLGLSTELLQTPVPVVVVVAVYLLWAGRLARGAMLAGAWALLPVAANIFYWHHDLFMGPRLLYEASPGWCLLVVAAGVGLVRDLGGKGRSGGLLIRVASRQGVAAVFVLALLVAVIYSTPRKLASYRSTVEGSGMNMEAPSVDRPSLVFVHGSWENRLGSRLAATGMRVDSIRAALRHNSTCRVEVFVSLLETRGGGPGGETPDQPSVSELDFEGSSDTPLRELPMPSGSVIRSYEDEVLTPACERQAASDFEGVVSLPPLLWQGDLPGLGTDGALFVHDHGPERNTRLLERFPDREPMVLARRGEEVRLMPYDRGMADLWSVAGSPRE